MEMLDWLLGGCRCKQSPSVRGDVCKQKNPPLVKQGPSTKLELNELPPRDKTCKVDFRHVWSKKKKGLEASILICPSSFRGYGICRSYPLLRNIFLTHSTLSGKAFPLGR